MLGILAYRLECTAMGKPKVRDNESPELKHDVPPQALVEVQRNVDQSIARVGEIGSLLSIDPAEFRILATFDTTTPEGKKLAYNCVQYHDAPALDMLNKEFGLANVLIHSVSFVSDETGESVQEFRTVMIDHQGKTIGCVSRGILRSLAAIEAIFGPPPWNPPIFVEIRQQQGRSARRYYTLRVA
jgi:hypothetical protein